MTYQKVLMYLCTMASACWLVLGITYSVPQAYLASVGFIALSFLYWDQSP